MYGCANENTTSYGNYRTKSRLLFSAPPRRQPAPVGARPTYSFGTAVCEVVVVMSAGETIMEDVMMFKEKRRLRNPDLHDYLLMSSKDEWRAAHEHVGRGMIRVIRQTLSCVAVLSLAVICRGQSASNSNRIAWLRENAVAVRSIDPADEEFDDLKRLGEAIGDARVVLLGEASHGDGAALLAKGRLIKYLHQHKGFDVLVWKSSFYECAIAGQAVANGAKCQDAFDKALRWTHGEQVWPTMQYAVATQHGKRPIAQAGMAWYNNAESPL